MKKKQLLATLVMLSLMQGNVYADEQPRLIGHSQWEGFIKFNSSSQTFSKDGEKLSFEDDGKTLNVEIDSELAGYNGAMDMALLFAKNDLNINFNVNNGGKGLSFIYDPNATDSNEVSAMLDASSATTPGADINISLDMGGGLLKLNQGQNAAIRMSGNANASLSVSNGSLYVSVDETSDFNRFSAAIYLDGNTSNQEKAYFRATDNIQNIDIVNKSDTLSLNDRLAIENRANLFLTAKDSIRIVGVDNENNIANDRRWGVGIYNHKNSNAEIKADKLIIDAQTAIAAQDSNSKVSITANEALLKGNIYAYGGADITFEKNGESSQLVKILSPDEDAIIAQPIDSPLQEMARVNFETDTIINSQKDASTEYANVSGIRTIAAIRALRLSEVLLTENDAKYQIYGDIIAGRGVDKTSEFGEDEGGQVNIGGSGSIIKGDVLAGNTGKINIELNNGFMEGRVDDYADATLKNMVFRPEEFDVAVTDGGTVNMTLNNSTWTARGQNFVTKLDFGAEGGFVDLSQDENNSVTIRNLNGNGTFNMLLNSEDHSKSDMLYIGKNTGSQTINIVGGITGGLENISKDNPLRFATVGIDSVSDVPDVNNSGISAYTRDGGVFDVEYTVEKEDFDKADAENEKYNGTGDGKGVDKPGNDFVENALVGNRDAVNWIITGAKEQQESDAGKTIINMSKVNYNNAIYMDRLNKRLGEARYISPEDEQGMWVRIRHDRIGKDDAFRSQNTMYEMGYDEKQDCENGERRVGLAIDYMDGKAEYTGIAGDGDVKRYGLWLYDTWMGDKGHYADYVAKWGHLENDFDIMARSTGEKITGDYSNNVFSVSAEYGKKNDMGNDWYFEPQAQLQLARVTGADYVTSQNTKVSLDGINSLIGRAGFRLGKDMGERSTVYVKADVLHEFLGDQTITATDVTGTLREEYENKGTWYDVGFGFATALGKDSYAQHKHQKAENRKKINPVAHIIFPPRLPSQNP